MRQLYVAGLVMVAAWGVRAEEVGGNDVADTDAKAAGWKLVWQDDFDKGGLPDEKKWGYEEGFVRNREKQFYTRGRKENARVEEGVLVIEARNEKWKNPGFDPNARRGDRRGRDKEFAEYTSASLTTKGKTDWTNGRIEARAKVPAGRGTWPAIWTLGSNMPQVGWPACGEIDVMEHVGFNPGVVHGTVHTKKYNHIAGTHKFDTIAVKDATEAFHLYAIEWDQKKIDFFIDQKKYFTFENEGKGADVWPFDKPQFLLMNLAIGGDWGGQKGIDDASFPQKLVVDYVRVYQAPGKDGDPPR